MEKLFERIKKVWDNFKIKCPFCNNKVFEKISFNPDYLEYHCIRCRKMISWIDWRWVNPEEV